MFGLGKLNFMVKRYELAERWFINAMEIKNDHVYRAWLGFTYMYMSQCLDEENPKRVKLA